MASRLMRPAREAMTIMKWLSNSRRKKDRIRKRKGIIMRRRMEEKKTMRNLIAVRITKREGERHTVH